MSRNFTLGQLTEGIRDRNVGQDGSRLMNKWTRTGLLRGLKETKREVMARLLENQAAQVLREANTMGSGGSAGNIDGFSNIAFPIVRRVFGGLVANELVSIQPMSLPSGLLFYLDYSYGSDVGHDLSGAGNAADAASVATAAAYPKGGSLYGSPGGSGIQAGADTIGGMYDLAGTAYSKVMVGRAGIALASLASNKVSPFHASAGAGGAYTTAGVWSDDAALETTNSKNLQLIQYDPQLVKELAENTAETYHILILNISQCADFDKTLAKSAVLLDDAGVDGTVHTTTVFGGNTGVDSTGALYQQGKNLRNLRRLNQVGTWTGSSWTQGTSATDIHLLMVVQGASFAQATVDTNFADFVVSFAVADQVTTTGAGGAGGALTIPSFESNFSGHDTTPIIPEIDIKIESIAVTAQTRKLRARWSPELAQDLNAYHSLDAEVELTQILSEQIALEIDREILNDLLVEAKGANFFWSRSPGKFVNKRSGAAQTLSSTLQIGPNFTGTVREWYETLVETIIDVANEIHRKTLRGSANFIVVSPEVATIFEASVLYKPSIKIDGQGQVAAPFSLGAEAIGSLTNRFTVYKDPYFPRNKILVGYKGGSYLESGYVYAPYVPLIVTPTIFAPEDFTPRKGVMTRYGKKMVRSDFYGTVTCLNMDVI